MPKTQVIIAAAGSGTRLGRDGAKALVPIAGKPMLARTLGRFRDAGLLDRCIVVVSEAHRADVIACVHEFFPGYLIQFVLGGAERQDSVGNALAALDPDTEIVAIHDAARPFVPVEAIQASVRAAAEHGGATVAVRCIDTILEGDEEGFLHATPDRRRMWACQTPQTFRVEAIRAAYAQARADGFLGTDDATVARRAGTRVQLVEGSLQNLKVTTPGDLQIAESLVREGVA